MFMKKAFAAVLATAVLVAGAVEAKDLRVASNTTFPPFEFVNTKTQEITGFEMDLIRAMGKQAGYEVKITNMAFDGHHPGSALRLRRRRAPPASPSPRSARSAFSSRNRSTSPA